MVDYPSIGVLVPTRKMRKRVLELYQRHNNIALKLFAFTRSGIIWKKNRILGLCRVGGKWEERMFPFPNAVYNQCYNRTTITVDQLNNVIGRDKCFNRINWFNKWNVYNLLIRSDLHIYTPETFLLNEVNLSDIMKKYKLVYIKPAYGYRGKNVFRLELKINGDIHMSLHSLAPRLICRKNENIEQKLATLLGNNINIFIVQEGIRSGQIDEKHYDLRVLVQKDLSGNWTVSTKVCRVANKLYFNTGAYESVFDAEEIFARIFPLEKMKETNHKSINEISVNAAQVLDAHMGLLGELSVDFILDEEMKWWIVEVNGKPQKSIHNDINNFKHEQLIYRRPIEYAYYLSMQGGQA